MTRVFDTVMQNFKTAQKSTQRYLSLGFVFTLLCFFYVVEPYFLYTTHQREAEESLTNIHAQLDVLELQLMEIRSVNDQTQRALDEIQTRVREYPDHLNRLILPQIYDQFYDENGGYGQERYTTRQRLIEREDDQISIPYYITEFADAVNWYVNTWFSEIVEDLHSDIVDPIAQHDLSHSEEKFDELDMLTHQAVNEVNQHLETLDPEYWHSYQDGQAETVEVLQSVIDQSFEPVTIQLNDLHDNISGNIEEMQSSLNKLTADSEAIERNLSLLDDRIRSMNTPFGPLPLRAIELITLFPILLVLIVAFTTISLAKSSRLYTELWDQFKADGKKDAREFQLLTDCWYLPPYKSFLQPALLILYTVTIAGIFIYSCYLIWSEPVIFNFPGIGEETFRRSLFLTGYIAGLLVLILSIRVGYRKIKEIPDLSQ